MINPDCCSFCCNINDNIEEEVRLNKKREINTEHEDSDGKYYWEKVPNTYDDSAAFRFRKVYKSHS